MIVIYTIGKAPACKYFILDGPPSNSCPSRNGIYIRYARKRAAATTEHRSCVVSYARQTGMRSKNTARENNMSERNTFSVGSRLAADSRKHRPAKSLRPRTAISLPRTIRPERTRRHVRV